MQNAITDLWKSERGLLCLALIIAATVLAALSVLTKADWLDYTKWIFGIYVGGKSITGAVQVATMHKVIAANAQVAEAKSGDVS